MSGSADTGATAETLRQIAPDRAVQRAARQEHHLEWEKAYLEQQRLGPGRKVPVDISPAEHHAEAVREMRLPSAEADDAPTTATRSAAGRDDARPPSVLPGRPVSIVTGGGGPGRQASGLYSTAVPAAPGSGYRAPLQRPPVAPPASASPVTAGQPAERPEQCSARVFRADGGVHLALRDPGLTPAAVMKLMGRLRFMLGGVAATLSRVSLNGESVWQKADSGRSEPASGAARLDRDY